MARSKYQAYDTEIIHRSQIKCADYNPRIMDKEAKKRLRKSLQQYGLVSALTWNRRTGNLVGGHQRLEQLDALESSADYELPVCVIDVDEETEAALNVQLNNPDMQGDWDTEKLAAMAESFDLSLEDMGFSKLTAEMLFDGDERFTELFETPESDGVKGKLHEIKDERDRMNKRQKEEAKIDYYITIVFPNAEERAAFQKEIHVRSSDIYVTPEQVHRLCGA